jgi:hypothetical protein
MNPTRKHSHFRTPFSWSPAIGLAADSALITQPEIDGTGQEHRWHFSGTRRAHSPRM